MCPPHPQPDRGAKWLARGNPRKPPFSTCGTTTHPYQQGYGIQLWSGKNCGVRHVNSRGHAKAWESITPTQGPTPKVWESMVKMSKKSAKRGWKWVKVGENPKMPYPQCGRSIQTYARGKNDAPSITKYGSPARLDTQIVALRPHCVRTALRAPPNKDWGHCTVCCLWGEPLLAYNIVLLTNSVPPLSPG